MNETLKSDSIKIIVQNDNIGAFICPKCDFLTVQDLSQFQGETQLECSCRCGHKYTAFLERRKFYRKSTHLNGTCTRSASGIPITIIDLSLTGLKLKTEDNRDFKIEDEFYVEFELDDEFRSKILRKVLIKSIDGDVIGAEFIRDETPSKMKPYLYFK